MTENWANDCDGNELKIDEIGVECFEETGRQSFTGLMKQGTFSQIIRSQNDEA